jgi:hypothetical protein
MSIDAVLVGEAARDIGIVLVNGFIVVAIVTDDLRWLIPCYLAICIISVEWLLGAGLI